MPDQLRQGPASFAIQTDDAVASASVPQIGTPQAQAAPLSLGITTQAPGVDDGDAKTFRAIMDLSSGILAPKVKEAAQAQYVQGVQQAMTGEGLSDIIKDKPWYTDIFAPSSALAGARTYTAQRAVAQWAGQMQDQMPVLARQGPEELQKAAVGAMQGFMTGDATTDAMMTSAVTEQMAPLFKQHAKEHYVYVQKQATTQQIATWEALGKVYQGVAVSAASGAGTVSPEDHDAAKGRFLGAIAPFADQSDESFGRNIQAFLEGSAGQGNFQVIKLFKDSGLYDRIPADQRMQLDRNLKVWGKEALNKATPQFAMDIATLVHDTTQDPASIPAKVAALNAKAAALTGVSEAELIPPGTVDNIMGNIMVAQRTEADARARLARTAAEKDAEKMGDLSIAASQINAGPGRVDACLALGVCKKEAVERAGFLAYQTAKTPEDRAKVLNSRTTGAYEPVKAQYAVTLRSPEWQAGVGHMAAEYQGLAEDVKTHYFDENERGLMDRFNAQVRSGMPPDAAWVAAKNGPALGAYMIAKDPKDEVSKAVRSEVERQHENIVGINQVDDASLRTIEAAAMRAIKMDRTNNPLDVSVKRGIAQAMANGVTLEGKHAIINDNPQDPPLFRVVGEGQGDTAAAFERLMSEKAKALGGSIVNYQARRVPDRNGKAYIYVQSTTDDGKSVNWTISSDELKQRAVEHIKQQRLDNSVPFGAVPPTGDMTVPWMQPTP